jgi:hypothetical protein
MKVFEINSKTIVVIKSLTPSPVGSESATETRFTWPKD